MLNNIHELTEGMEAMNGLIASSKAACEASMREAKEHRLAIEKLAALPMEVSKCEETREIVERLKKELADLELQKDNDEQQCRCLISCALPTQTMQEHSHALPAQKKARGQ